MNHENFRVEQSPSVESMRTSVEVLAQTSREEATDDEYPKYWSDGGRCEPTTRDLEEHLRDDLGWDIRRVSSQRGTPDYHSFLTDDRAFDDQERLIIDPTYLQFFEKEHKGDLPLTLTGTLEEIEEFYKTHWDLVGKDLIDVYKTPQNFVKKFYIKSSVPPKP